MKTGMFFAQILAKLRYNMHFYCKIVITREEKLRVASVMHLFQLLEWFRRRIDGSSYQIEEQLLC